MKRIPLTQGKFALVDDADFERVSQFKWYAVKEHNVFYAARMHRKLNGKRAVQKMHIFLVGTPAGMETHHKNENGLDNQRLNLVTLVRADHALLEARLRRTNTSGFRGVSFLSRTGRWMARIQHRRIGIHVGYFATAKEAALARDKTARDLGRSERVMNFPQ